MNGPAMENNCQQSVSQSRPTVGGSIRRGLFRHVGPSQGQQGFPAVKGPAHRCPLSDGGEG